MGTGGCRCTGNACSRAQTPREVNMLPLSPARTPHLACCSEPPGPLALALHPIFLPKQFLSTWVTSVQHTHHSPVSQTPQQLPLPGAASLSSRSLTPPPPRRLLCLHNLKGPNSNGSGGSGQLGPLHKQGRPRWWARSETSLYCLYRTNMRNRERPVGKRENCHK